MITNAAEKEKKETVLSECAVTLEKGLDSIKIEERREKYGRNELAEKKQKSALVKFLLQFNDPMIYILFAAAIISIILKEVTDTVIILIVVLLNGIIGYIQESKAEKAIEALKKLSNPKALVRRGGKVQEIEAHELVAGDIVLLEAGRFVPADLRLLETSSLKIEESALTGESVPVEKDSDFIADSDLPLGDRVNMAYMSTNVTYGRGTGVVVATGMNTEIGKIARILEESGDEMTPLQKRLADLGKVLGALAVGLCLILFVVAVMQKRNIFEMLLTAISLAVAAIPEGLPAVVTIVLAIGVQRMVKSRSIIRRLPAVETLGSVNIVCSDKTGTLTQNRMTVVECYANNTILKPDEMDKASSLLFIHGFTLCNDASIAGGEKIGDPTETALLDFAAKFNISREELENEYPRKDEIPFDSVRKMMTTLHKAKNGEITYTKGALDSLMRHVRFILDNGSIRDITDEDKININEAARSMASRALRVLALGYKENGGVSEDNLVFTGLVGMIDPPREEAKESVGILKKAGVTTVMITGDHKDTAYAIAKELGIAHSPEQVISGDELNKLTQEQLNEKVMKLRVFARVSPENKVMIVKAFKANGNIVSMTGDGVNDAPSLKAADIGVAMGITGTDAAKGAADMILTDDNFSTIQKAIEEGRNIYNNIRKSTLYLLASNFGEIITMFFAIIIGWAAPLTPIQILWVNLVTDSLPGLALGVDPGDRNVMKHKPRRISESLFSGEGKFNLIIYGFLIGGITLLGYYIGYREGGFALGNSIALSVLALSELFHAIGMRNTDRSIFTFNHLNNRMLIISIILGIALQIFIIQTPFLDLIFSTHPMTLWHWAQTFMLALTPLAMHEIIVLFKFIKRKAAIAK